MLVWKWSRTTIQYSLQLKPKNLLKQPAYSKHALFVEQTSHSGRHYIWPSVLPFCHYKQWTVVVISRFPYFCVPTHTCGGASGFFVLLKLTCGIVQICQRLQETEETEQNYLSDDGDMGIRQNWARGIHSKWTITWCLSTRSSNPWAAAAHGLSPVTTAVCK